MWTSLFVWQAAFRRHVEDDTGLYKTVGLLKREFDVAVTTAPGRARVGRRVPRVDGRAPGQQAGLQVCKLRGSVLDGEVTVNETFVKIRRYGLCVYRSGFVLIVVLFFK